MTEKAATKMIDPPVDQLPIIPETAAEPDPLAKRFLNLRTLLSFVIGLGIVALVVIVGWQLHHAGGPTDHVCFRRRSAHRRPTNGCSRGRVNKETPA